MRLLHKFNHHPLINGGNNRNKESEPSKEKAKLKTSTITACCPFENRVDEEEVKERAKAPTPSFFIIAKCDGSLECWKLIEDVFHCICTWENNTIEDVDIIEGLCVLRTDYSSRHNAAANVHKINTISHYVIATTNKGNILLFTVTKTQVIRNEKANFTDEATENNENSWNIVKHCSKSSSESYKFVGIPFLIQLEPFSDMNNNDDNAIIVPLDSSSSLDNNNIMICVLVKLIKYYDNNNDSSNSLDNCICDLSITPVSLSSKIIQDVQIIEEGRHTTENNGITPLYGTFDESGNPLLCLTISQPRQHNSLSTLYCVCLTTSNNTSSRKATNDEYRLIHGPWYISNIIMEQKVSIKNHAFHNTIENSQCKLFSLYPLVFPSHDKDRLKQFYHHNSICKSSSSNNDNSCGVLSIFHDKIVFISHNSGILCQEKYFDQKINNQMKTRVMHACAVPPTTTTSSSSQSSNSFIYESTVILISLLSYSSYKKEHFLFRVSLCWTRIEKDKCKKDYDLFSSLSSTPLILIQRIYYDCGIQHHDLWNMIALQNNFFLFGSKVIKIPNDIQHFPEGEKDGYLSEKDDEWFSQELLSSTSSNNNQQTKTAFIENYLSHHANQHYPVSSSLPIRSAALLSLSSNSFCFYGDDDDDEEENNNRKAKLFLVGGSGANAVISSNTLSTTITTTNQIQQQHHFDKIAYDEKTDSPSLVSDHSTSPTMGSQTQTIPFLFQDFSVDVGLGNTSFFHTPFVCLVSSSSRPNSYIIDNSNNKSTETIKDECDDSMVLRYLFLFSSLNETIAMTCDTNFNTTIKTTGLKMELEPIEHPNEIYNIDCNNRTIEVCPINHNLQHTSYHGDYYNQNEQKQQQERSHNFNRKKRSYFFLQVTKRQVRCCGRYQQNGDMKLPSFNMPHTVSIECAAFSRVYDREQTSTSSILPLPIFCGTACSDHSFRLFVVWDKHDDIMKTKRNAETNNIRERNNTKEFSLSLDSIKNYNKDNSSDKAILSDFNSQISALSLIQVESREEQRYQNNSNLEFHTMMLAIAFHDKPHHIHIYKTVVVKNSTLWSIQTMTLYHSVKNPSCSFGIHSLEFLPCPPTSISMTMKLLIGSINGNIHVTSNISCLYDHNDYNTTNSELLSSYSDHVKTTKKNVIEGSTISIKGSYKVGQSTPHFSHYFYHTNHERNSDANFPSSSIPSPKEKGYWCILASCSSILKPYPAAIVITNNNRIGNQPSSAICDQDIKFMPVHIKDSNIFYPPNCTQNCFSSCYNSSSHKNDYEESGKVSPSSHSSRDRDIQQIDNELNTSFISTLISPYDYESNDDDDPTKSKILLPTIPSLPSCLWMNFSGKQLSFASIYHSHPNHPTESLPSSIHVESESYGLLCKEIHSFQKSPSSSSSSLSSMLPSMNPTHIHVLNFQNSKSSYYLLMVILEDSDNMSAQVKGSQIMLYDVMKESARKKHPDYHKVSNSSLWEPVWKSDIIPPSKVITSISDCPENMHTNSTQSSDDCGSSCSNKGGSCFSCCQVAISIVDYQDENNKYFYLHKKTTPPPDIKKEVQSEIIVMELVDFVNDDEFFHRYELIPRARCTLNGSCFSLCGVPSIIQEEESSEVSQLFPGITTELYIFHGALFAACGNEIIALEWNRHSDISDHDLCHPNISEGNNITNTEDQNSALKSILGDLFLTGSQSTPYETLVTSLECIRGFRCNNCDYNNKNGSSKGKIGRKRVPNNFIYIVAMQLLHSAVVFQYETTITTTNKSKYVNCGRKKIKLIAVDLQKPHLCSTKIALSINAYKQILHILCLDQVNNEVLCISASLEKTKTGNKNDDTKTSNSTRHTCEMNNKNSVQTMVSAGSL